MENVEMIELEDLKANPLKGMAKKIADANLKVRGRYSCTVGNRKITITLKGWKEVAL
jgi:hypothetical protein